MTRIPGTRSHRWFAITAKVQSSRSKLPACRGPDKVKVAAVQSGDLGDTQPQATATAASVMPSGKSAWTSIN